MNNSKFFQKIIILKYFQRLKMFVDIQNVVYNNGYFNLYKFINRTGWHNSCAKNFSSGILDETS